MHPVGFEPAIPASEQLETAWKSIPTHNTELWYVGMAQLLSTYSYTNKLFVKNHP
jgi:hypothetical protein